MIIKDDNIQVYISFRVIKLINSNNSNSFYKIINNSDCQTVYNFQK